jgi:hypothetical protein
LFACFIERNIARNRAGERGTQRGVVQMATRRDFMLGAAAATLPRLIITGIGGPAAAAEGPVQRENDWDQGEVQHLIPTASHDRFLIKVSFAQPQSTAPELEVGATRVRGQANTAASDFWQFDVPGLAPATSYKLSLIGAGGSPGRFRPSLRRTQCPNACG